MWWKGGAVPPRSQLDYWREGLVARRECLMRGLMCGSRPTHGGAYFWCGH